SGDVLVALAENPELIARRGECNVAAAQGVLRGGEIGLALLPILQRAAFRQIQLLRPLRVALRLGELRGGSLGSGAGGDQRIRRLPERGRLAREQRRAAFAIV